MNKSERNERFRLSHLTIVNTGVRFSGVFGWQEWHIIGKCNTTTVPQQSKPILVDRLSLLQA
jgi:hypothetical protein